MPVGGFTAMWYDAVLSSACWTSLLCTPLTGCHSCCKRGCQNWWLHRSPSALRTTWFRFLWTQREAGSRERYPHAHT